MLQIEEIENAKEKSRINLDTKKENEYKSQITNLEKENSNLTKGNQVLAQELEELKIFTEKKINSLEQEKSKLLEELGTLEEDYKDLEESYSEFSENSKKVERKLKVQNQAYEKELTQHRIDVVEYTKRNKGLEQELAEMIQRMRQNPRSTGSAGGADKNERIIVESLSMKNNELMTENKKLSKDSRKYYMMSTEFENIMNFRQQSLIKVIDELTKQDIARKDKIFKNITEEENARVYNAKHNKSIEDMRELVERIV